MQYRRLGKTDVKVSAISFGAWAIGSAWGPVDDEESLRALHAAIDSGVNFIDTADVYGDGRSERLIARLKKERPHDTIWVATKIGRRLQAQTPDGYTRDNMISWVDRCLLNLEVEAIDLLQLHCPHPMVYDRPEVFGVLDELIEDGKVRHYGVSVETVDEALKAIAYPHVSSVQIIFNMFRLKPADFFFEQARAHDVGIIARVPLASGLLTGKIRRDTPFHPDDHRHFNRHGEQFDKGETFSGVPLNAGLAAVHDLSRLPPPVETLTQFALRWILMWDAVSCAIPGAKRPAQARENAAAADLPPISDSKMAAVRKIYDDHIRSLVHHQW